MESLRRVAATVDEAVFQVERALLVFSLGMMTLLVAVDVTQRTFSRQEGKVAGLLLWLMGPVSEATRAQVNTTVGPALFAVVAYLLVVLAVQSRNSMAAQRAGGPLPSLASAVVPGTVVYGSSAALIALLLWLFPSSVPGAQKFALGFMLWSGMLGASLATRARRHIVLDQLIKRMDEGTARGFSALGGVVTFACCGGLAFLGWMQFGEQVREWAGGDGVGVYDALPIPLWVATLSVPVTFTVMAARFLGHGVSDLVWGLPKGGADAHGIDLEALAKESVEVPR